MGRRIRGLRKMGWSKNPKAVEHVNTVLQRLLWQRGDSLCTFLREERPDIVAEHEHAHFSTRFSPNSLQRIPILLLLCKLLSVLLSALLFGPLFVIIHVVSHLSALSTKSCSSSIKSLPACQASSDLASISWSCTPPSISLFDTRRCRCWTAVLVLSRISRSCTPGPVVELALEALDSV